MRRAFAFAILAAAFSLSACGRSETTTISTPDGNATVTASSDGSILSVTSASGQAAQITMGSAASAQLPDFLPLFPGAKVTTSFAAPDPATQGGSVSFETTATPADVIAFYKQKATAQGLRETISANAGDTMTYMASKEQVVVQVIASKGKSATDTVLSWAIPRGK